MTPRDQLQTALTDAISAVNDERAITRDVPILAVTLPADVAGATSQAEAWLVAMGWPLPAIPAPGQS